eukprot:Skav228269  [mRNA]  locus=scaffold5658:15642:20535:+ [translate_table: standard]
MNANRSRLTKPVTAIRRLRFPCRVVAAIEVDHVVGSGEVQTDAATLQHHHQHLAVGLGLEALLHPGALLQGELPHEGQHLDALEAIADQLLKQSHDVNPRGKNDRFLIRWQHLLL